MKNKPENNLDKNKLQLSEKSEDEKHLTELKRNPSPLGWKRELDKLWRGDRTVQITLIGSVSDYVRSIIADSDDEFFSREYFKTAFNELIGEVSLVTGTDSQVNLFLTLVVSFLPPNGINKICNHLREGIQFEENFHPPGSYTPTNLHLKALVALRAFFQANFYDTANPLFRVYVGILRQHLFKSRYVGFAVIELIKLEILQPGTEEMRLIIAKQPRIVKNLVEFFSNEQRRNYRQSDLINLATDCFSIKSTIEPFKTYFDTLEEVGDIQYADELLDENKNRDGSVPIWVDFHNGGRYEFGLTDEQILLYAKHSLEVEKERLPSVKTLLENADLDLKDREKGLSVHFYRSVGLGYEAINSFVKTLKDHNAGIAHDWISEGISIVIANTNESIELEIRKSLIERYIHWQFGNPDTTNEETLIDDRVLITEEENRQLGYPF